MGFTKKFLHARAWKRLFFEKLTEPLHLNLIAAAVAVFGSFRSKVTFDLVIREYHAYGLLKAADLARRWGVREITAVEFGVATGAGLMNMAKIALKVKEATGVDIKVVGFDTGKGMPPAVDFRDHPDLYRQGDFVMNVDKLRAALPPNCELVLGELRDTLPKWMLSNQGKRPIGYVEVDVDYYSSTVEALALFKGAPENYLPYVVTYFDDIMFDEHNDACGELLAIREFNASNPQRLFQRPTHFAGRAYKNAPWLKQIYFCHVLDHGRRREGDLVSPPHVLVNPYL